MQQDLFSSIKAALSSLTKKEKHIANYILFNAESAQYMSISDLAAACNVGETSIFRFCKHLGKSGYQDFKVALTQAVSQSVGSISFPDCIVGHQDDTQVMMQKVLNNSLSVLQETFQLLDRKALHTATDWLLQADRICFFGVGAASTTAIEAQNRFLRFCSKVEAMPDFRIQYMRASLMTPQDIAIFFSYTGSFKETLSIAQAAKQSGAKTIAVTHFSHSPLAELCDLLFLCGGNDGPYQSGSLSVKTAQLFLVEMLAISYSLADTRNCAHMQTLTKQAFHSEIKP